MVAARHEPPSGPEDVSRPQGAQKLLHGVHGVGGRKPDVWAVWTLIGVVDSCEALELSGSGLGVEPLRISPFALLQWRVDEHLDERDPVLLVNLAGQSDDPPRRG